MQYKKVIQTILRTLLGLLGCWMSAIVIWVFIDYLLGNTTRPFGETLLFSTCIFPTYFINKYIRKTNKK